MIVFRKIKYEDLEMVLEWRTHPNILKVLTYVDKDIEKQRLWWIETENDPSKEYRIVNIDGVDFGIFSMTDIDLLNRKVVFGAYAAGGSALINPFYLYDVSMATFNHAFNDLNINRITTTVGVDNYRSIRFHKFIGFKQEGLLKQWVYRNDKYEDVYIMCFLKEQWNPVKVDYRFD